MQTVDALALTQNLINTGAVHQDYGRTVELADTYLKLITGKDIGSLLIQFVKREDAELFAQRIRMTKVITPAVHASIRGPYNRVMRNDRIRTDITLQNENKKPIIENMQLSFYGSQRKKTRGLNYWLKTRFLELQFSDPNAWVVIEWEKAPDDTTPVKPRPFEVPAAWAVNYFAVNDETKWLMVKQPITYKAIKTQVATNNTGVRTLAPTVVPGTEGVVIVPPVANVPTDILGGTTESGYRWTLYDEDVTVVYEQVDPQYLKASGYDMSIKGEHLEQINKIYYLVRTFDPKVGYVPAFRIGYKRDDWTAGRTFVNPWHDALCFFEKSLKTVSELDLTMALHVFPQKLQYVSKCEGLSKTKRCNNGKVAGTTEECSVCKGTGYKVHTSAQDAIFLPLPDTPTSEDIIDLEKLIAYKAPSIETVQFQNNYILQLEQQVHRTVFNTQVLVKSTGTGTQGTGGQINNTATGVDANMQGVYDALEPCTEKISEFYREITTLFAVLAGEKADKVTVTHEFPATPQLKTLETLMSDRKVATDAGAPQFLISTIDDDMATMVYVGDPVSQLEYRVKKAFAPFGGKSPDEIAGLVASQYVPKETKVLYSNFAEIFVELEEENADFYKLDTRKQNELVTEKVQEFIVRLQADEPALDLSRFREANPAAGSNPVSSTDGVTDQGTPGANEQPGDAGNTQTANNGE